MDDIIYEVLHIFIHRDSKWTPWGFRLLGSDKCLEVPLYVNKVTFKSPASEAGLKKGDVLLGIGQKSAMNPPMSHQQASDLIKNSGNNLDLTVRRNPLKASRTSPVKTVSGAIGIIPTFDTTSYSLPSEQERLIYHQEKQKERQSVVNQPHRTFPMVQPKPKPIHDYPMGCYLNYMKDPNWHSCYKSSSSNEPSEKLRGVINQLAPNQESKLVNLQYNSPINMYSEDNIAQNFFPQARSQSPHNQVIHQPLRPNTPTMRASPTYQIIHEQKRPRSGNRSPIKYITMVANNEYHPPAQSQSFKNLMHALGTE